MYFSAKIISRRGAQPRRQPVAGGYGPRRGPGVSCGDVLQASAGRQVGDESVAQQHVVYGRHGGTVLMAAAEAVEVHAAAVAAAMTGAVMSVTCRRVVLMMTQAVVTRHGEAHRAVGIVVMMLQHGAAHERHGEGHGQRHFMQACFHTAKLQNFFGTAAP